MKATKKLLKEGTKVYWWDFPIPNTVKHGTIVKQSRKVPDEYYIKGNDNITYVMNWQFLSIPN